MQPHPRSRIIPDYTCTPRELYIQIVVAHIMTTGSLDILSLVYGEKTHDLDIPSYVPDWTAHVDFSKHAALGIRERNIKCYDTSAGSNVALQHNPHGEIRLSGMLVDTIAEIVDVHDLVSKLSCLSERRFNQLKNQKCLHGQADSILAYLVWRADLGWYFRRVQASQSRPFRLPSVSDLEGNNRL